MNEIQTIFIATHNIAKEELPFTDFKSQLCTLVIVCFHDLEHAVCSIVSVLCYLFKAVQDNIKNVINLY